MKINIINNHVVGFIFFILSNIPSPLLDEVDVDEIDDEIDDEKSGIDGNELSLDCKIEFVKLLEELIIIKIYILFYCNFRIIYKKFLFES